MGITRVSLAGMLGVLLFTLFAASASLVQGGRLDRAVAPVSDVGSATILKDANLSAPVGAVHQANRAAPQQREMLSAAFPELGTILAAAALALPFGLSAYLIQHRKRAA